MAQDNTDKFKRPLPLRQNERLRESLNAPDVTNPNNPSFPVEGLAPSNRQPQKSSSTKKPINRGEITRRDDDVINDISIGLQDHDEAIAFYFDKVIKPSVVTNGTRIAVPLIYGNPERWKGVQRDGYYRDKTGKIQTPIIMFKRNSIQKRRDLGNKMDANNPQLYYVYQSKYNKRNQYDNFSVLQNRVPNKEFHAVVVPDFVRLKYSFIIWTDFIGQQGRNRMVKTNFELDLQGYIVSDAMSTAIAKKPQKFFSKSTVVFNTEIITTSGPAKTREEVRKESGEYKVGRNGEGIGYEGIGDDTI